MAKCPLWINLQVISCEFKKSIYLYTKLLPYLVICPSTGNSSSVLQLQSVDGATGDHQIPVQSRAHHQSVLQTVDQRRWPL